MLIPQTHVQFNGVHWYCLQPGDGTRYQFGFIDPANAYVTDPSKVAYTANSGKTIRGNDLRIGVDKSPETAHVGDVISGIGRYGEDYIIVIVDMPGGQGCYTVRKDSLDDVDRHVVGYYNGHTGNHLYPNTICAVLLAVSVLRHNPNNVVCAAQKMLEWVDIMSPLEEEDK